MKKKSGLARKILLCFFLLVILINIYLIFFVPYTVTGHDTNAFGMVTFAILGNYDFEILSPENITYNFSASDSFILNLSGTSSGPADYWIYHLYDARHNRWYSENVSFGISNSYFRNTTFSAVRWENILFVEGWWGNNVVSKNVSFYLNVSNSAPILGPIGNPLYVCESGVLFYVFNATDLDEEDLNYQFISPSSAFGMAFFGRDETINYFYLFSGLLTKGPSGVITVNEGSRNYPVRIEVSDKEAADNKSINITVIQINNAPEITPSLTVQTLWRRGENSSYYVDVNFTDVETMLGYGFITPSLTIRNSSGAIVNLFNMSSQGVINFTATNQTPLGVYNVSVCVTDYGILNPHPRIMDFCNQNGGNITTCDNFGLTITNLNRPPTIIEHNPDSSELINASSIQPIYFNITKYDPDGTIPDAYWYVDNKLIEYDEGSLVDSFTYAFGCGSSGRHKVVAQITDGELNDSVQWNISLSLVACPVDDDNTGGGGGGGGGGAPKCSPKWICNPWSICQHAKSSLDLGILSGVNYRVIENDCNTNYYESARCGYQIRGCIDASNCSFPANKPEELQSCLYTTNPSCKDGIQNCHDDLCELLIDCGGPCKACPTCSDKVKNQGEEGVDCGGPCPWRCIPEIPLLKRSNTIYIFLIIILIIIIFVIIKLMRVLWYRRAIENSKKPNV